MANDDLLSDDEEVVNLPVPVSSINGGGTALSAPALSKAAAPSPVAVMPSEILLLIMEKVRSTIMLVGWFYSGLVFLLCVAAVILLGPQFIWLADKNSPILMNMARIIVSLVAIGTSLGCFAVLLKSRELKLTLLEAEGQIDSLRDQAFLQLQATRYNLEDLTERLEFPKDKQSPSPLDYINVAKQLGPLLSLWNAKERSLVTLGVEGLKFYQALKKILNR